MIINKLTSIFLYQIKRIVLLLWLSETFSFNFETQTKLNRFYNQVFMMWWALNPYPGEKLIESCPSTLSASLLINIYLQTYMMKSRGKLNPVIFFNLTTVREVWLIYSMWIQGFEFQSHCWWNDIVNTLKIRKLWNLNTLQTKISQKS